MNKLDFGNIVKSKIPMLRSLIAELNFHACMNFGSDLLRHSEFIKYKEGVFIGEIIENLFGNIQSLNDVFGLKQEDITDMLNEIYPLLDFLEKNLLQEDKDKKIELYNLLINARYAVTEKQITYFREQKPNKINRQNTLPPTSPSKFS